MSLTLSQARDAINQKFWDDWNSLAGAQNGGTVPLVRWQGEDDGDKPPATSPWARVTILHATSSQDVLGVAGGGRSFERTGSVIINIFAPLSGGQGLTQAEALAIIAQNAFEGQTAGAGDCIWFRNVTVNEIGPDGAWFQFNVTADFLYPENK